MNYVHEVNQSSHLLIFYSVLSSSLFSLVFFFIQSCLLLQRWKEAKITAYDNFTTFTKIWKGLVPYYSQDRDFSWAVPLAALDPLVSQQEAARAENDIKIALSDVIEK
jgi:hypothetical protein